MGESSDFFYDRKILKYYNIAIRMDKLANVSIQADTQKLIPSLFSPFSFLFLKQYFRKSKPYTDSKESLLCELLVSYIKILAFEFDQIQFLILYLLCGKRIDRKYKSQTKKDSYST